MSLQRIELPFDVELLPVKQLSAGNITCLYEKGNLRYIKFGDEEVVRMIYSAVRDENWATAPYEVENEVIDANESSFSIRYTAFYRLNDIQYKAFIQIEGKENAITFSMHGEALSNFLRNRIGICVLHPIAECAGKKVVIIHPDGKEIESVFPEKISPHQPFKQVRRMQWQSDSAEVVLHFEGDVFETEDQRNWTDYSYKTYSTPLYLPMPVQVNKGDTIQQSVRLQVAASDARPVTTKEQLAADDQTRFSFPKVGYERPPGSPHLTSDEIDLLKQFLFHHYRVILHLSKEDWQQELDLAASEARALHLPLEVVVFFSSSMAEELNQMVAYMQPFSHHISSILLLQEDQPVTPAKLLQQAYPMIKSGLPHVKVGYGTDGFFADLNRNRPSQDMPFDFISYSLAPQVHATDTRTLIENLSAQGDTVKLAKDFAPGKEIFVSPVTFKIRDNQEGSSSSGSDEDSRMYGFFGAMWTLLAIKNLAGADSITFYQLTGYRGIVNDSVETRNELYQVLKHLGAFQPKWILPDGNDPFTLHVENAQGEKWAFSFTKDAAQILGL